MQHLSVALYCSIAPLAANSDSVQSSLRSQMRRALHVPEHYANREMCVPTCGESNLRSASSFASGWNGCSGCSGETQRMLEEALLDESQGARGIDAGLDRYAGVTAFA